MNKPKAISSLNLLIGCVLGYIILGVIAHVTVILTALINILS
jgi:hypothetical protein